MPIDILMPALSSTMQKGNLRKWLKKEGETIKSGDVIAEVETDKATMEVEAVDDGTMGKIIVPEGTEDVAVNAVIAVILDDRPEGASKSPVQDGWLNPIASAVTSFDVAGTPIWADISERYPGAKMFAIDTDARTFEISDGDRFDGRADILISVPHILRSGRST
jgi:pyruvate/2-oxoglutarate dehydrogenase complex dihydrolipoamide acyltransferase (E2) component